MVVVGIMIGVNFKILSRPLRRYSLMAGAALFFSLVSVSSVGAIETIKASALQLHLASEQDNIPSFKSSPSVRADSCLPLLKQVRLSPDGSAMNQSQRSAGNRASMPVTLGFLIGVRVALGPKEVVKSGRRVQIGPEILQRYDTGESYALAIANYRSCKNKQALKQK